MIFPRPKTKYHFIYCGENLFLPFVYGQLSKPYTEDKKFCMLFFLVTPIKYLGKSLI